MTGTIVTPMAFVLTWSVLVLVCEETPTGLAFSSCVGRSAASRHRDPQGTHYPPWSCDSSSPYASFVRRGLGQLWGSSANAWQLPVPLSSNNSSQIPQSPLTAWRRHVFSDHSDADRQHNPCWSLTRRESPVLTALVLRPRLAKPLPILTGGVMTRGFAPNPLTGHPGTFPFCHFLWLPLVITFSLVQRKRAQGDTGWADPASQSSIPDQELGPGTKIPLGR